VPDKNHSSHRDVHGTLTHVHPSRIRHWTAVFRAFTTVTNVTPIAPRAAEIRKNRLAVGEEVNSAATGQFNFQERV